MRARAAVLIGVLALLLGPALTACSSDDEPAKAEAGETSSRLPSPTAEVTEIAVACKKFAGTAKKIAAAQADLYAGATERADDLVATLGGLKAGAPVAVKDAIDDLADAFRKAADLMEKPSLKARAALAKMAPTFAAAGKKITDYVVEKCTS